MPSNAFQRQRRTGVTKGMPSSDVCRVVIIEDLLRLNFGQSLRGRNGHLLPVFLATAGFVLAGPEAAAGMVLFGVM